MNARSWNKMVWVQELKKRFFYLLLLVPFAFYAFGREALLYFDSYHIAGLSCGYSHVVNHAPLVGVVFPLLPCNVLFFKLVMLAALVVAVFLLERMEENAGYWAFLLPAFLLEFLRWENELFAYVLLFAATFFLLRSFKKRLWVNQFASAGLVLLACGFWAGALFYPFVVALQKKAWVMRALAVLFALFFGQQLLAWFYSSFFLPDPEVIVGLGLIWLLPGLFLAIVGVPLRDWRNPLWPALALGYLKAQLIVYSLVFVPLGIGLFVRKYPSTARPLKIVAVVMLLIGSLAIPLQYPYPDVHSAVRFALKLSASDVICNDWGIGYLVQWHGGQPKWDSGHRGNVQNCSGITVSIRDLNNCALIKSFGHYRVWKCPQKN